MSLNVDIYKPSNSDWRADTIAQCVQAAQQLCATPLEKIAIQTTCEQQVRAHEKSMNTEVRHHHKQRFQDGGRLSDSHKHGHLKEYEENRADRVGTKLARKITGGGDKCHEFFAKRLEPVRAPAPRPNFVRQGNRPMKRIIDLIQTGEQSIKYAWALARTSYEKRRPFSWDAWKNTGYKSVEILKKVEHVVFAPPTFNPALSVGAGATTAAMSTQTAPIFIPLF